jgi:hypothetical protein
MHTHFTLRERSPPGYFARSQVWLVGTPLITLPLERSGESCPDQATATVAATTVSLFGLLAHTPQTTSSADRLTESRVGTPPVGSGN